MARAPVMAAGGIVLRREQTPLVAVVRLRKRDEWVLPKGKLDPGETARAAARREVLEETGHDVTVHEFLGTLVYEINGRTKVVHYWRMEACAEQTHELMSDIRAVDWLPLKDALERLSRISERAFLANVGPQALQGLARKARAKPPAARKRGGGNVVAPEPVLPDSMPALPQPGEVAPSPAVMAGEPAVGDVVAVGEVVDLEMPAEAIVETEPPGALEPEARVEAIVESRRWNLAQKVRDWLGRAA